MTRFRSRPETPSLGIFDRTLFADGLKAQKGMVTTGPALRWILWILLELTGFVLLDLETIAGLASIFFCERRRMGFAFTQSSRLAVLIASTAVNSRSASIS